jgi:hypothetical protein
MKRFEKYRHELENTDHLPFIYDDEHRKKVYERIWMLLGSQKVYKKDVGAFYFDYSAIPPHFNRVRDSYLIFGCTHEGEIISKWVDRWDLDNDD